MVKMCWLTVLELISGDVIVECGAVSFLTKNNLSQQCFCIMNSAQLKRSS